ncbi:predicted protein [Sclerotinia sclerotiorum 1980 UF-70]|uniref:Uncharacterized protein n=1 Tax=Sclerotinia sclerotiorum (strain ATCC 18683 / 1980 / Ss-1) TaxID=665079 RepID=A7EM66_SCLS1|nr:predicted protein [Sclerotinia sclerotiorum 1980 UF-70]EDO03932.1 predicted protein [Sclerotinia sclerotiorum 1980 UF-70]
MDPSTNPLPRLSYSIDRQSFPGISAALSTASANVYYQYKTIPSYYRSDSSPKRLLWLLRILKIER